MQHRPLKRDALFVVAESPRRAWLLPRGTYVDLLDQHAFPPSPLTRQRDELFIAAPDETGKVWQGFLARNAKLGRPELSVLGDPWLPAPLGKRRPRPSAWDAVRMAIATCHPFGGVDKRGHALYPWSATSWVSYYGHHHPVLLAQVIRELGGAVPKTRVPDHLVRRCLSTIHRKEIPMSAVKESRTQTAALAEHDAAKANAKKTARAKQGAAKAAAKDAKPPRQTMARTVGETLAALCAEAKVSTFKVASALAGGKDASKKDLLALRDAINQLSEKLREKRKMALASKFSGVNRLVRRLIRAK